MKPSYFDRLAPEQKKLPYAKFLDFPYPDPVIPSAVAGKIAAPMRPDQALKLELAGDLLDAGYDADDMGYCLLEDGTGYIGEKFIFPGATREMFAWWFVWHGLEEVRYKIWDPEAHVSSRVLAAHLEKRLDPSLAMKDRLTDTAHFTTHVSRDGVPDPAVMCFVSPDAFGLDMTRAGAEAVSVVAALHGKAGSPFPGFCSIRVLRDSPEGFSMRIYFWLGKIPLGGHFIRLNTAVTLAETAFLAEHCAQEYNRLASILPSIYAENHGVRNSPGDFSAIRL